MQVQVNEVVFNKLPPLLVFTSVRAISKIRTSFFDPTCLRDVQNYEAQDDAELMPM